MSFLCDSKISKSLKKKLKRKNWSPLVNIHVASLQSIWLPMLRNRECLSRSDIFFIISFPLLRVI